MRKVSEVLRRIDWILFLSVLTLCALGLLAIWSVDLAQDPGRFLNFKKAIAFAAGGFLAAIGLSYVDYRALRALTRPLYILGFLVLAGVLVFGIKIRGTQGWFGVGSLTLQPVEFAKLILILVLAKYLDWRAHVVDLKVVFNLILLAGLYIMLTLLQPDFGSALVLLSIAAGMLLFTSIPRRYVLGGAIASTVIAFFAWSFLLRDFQKERLTSFINPEADPFGRGYNIRQSVIAVGAGGMLGRGLGQGSQSQLRFLPEAQTDFVFAVLAEQLGLLVVLIIVGAYALVGWRLWIIMRKHSDGFAIFTVAGFFVLLAVQVISNIGMNLGLLPIVGLPLPFVSLGGSAMLANFLMLGVVQSIKVRG